MQALRRKLLLLKERKSRVLLHQERLLIRASNRRLLREREGKLKLFITKKNWMKLWMS
jgi:hypothetical protein